MFLAGIKLKCPVSLQDSTWGILFKLRYTNVRIIIIIIIITCSDTYSPAVQPVYYHIRGTNVNLSSNRSHFCRLIDNHLVNRPTELG